MDKEKYLQFYWKNYIALEKEFFTTLEYITLDSDNYQAFSLAFIKLLLQIGSEIDINAKILCEQYNKHAKLDNMDDCRCGIMESEVGFYDTEVTILQHCNIPPFKPWGSWKDGKNPSWWRAYNKVKHERMETGKIGDVRKEYYKFANLENTLFALGGLYQLCIHVYFGLVDLQEMIKVPIPGSHLFKLSGNRWEEIQFYQDLAFFVDSDSGHLVYESGVY